MSPSSLIFVAVVASWATYLVVHVARRREQLATARNVDRFSSQMRVLQRRAAANVTVESRGRVTSTSLGVDHPLVAGSARRMSSPAVEAHTLIEGRPSIDLDEAVAPKPRKARKGRAKVSPAFALMGRFAGVSMHEVRGVLLLTAVLVALSTAVLAAFDVLGWFVPALAALAAVLVVWRMRAATLARRAARSRAAATRRREHDRGEKLRRQAQVAARPEATAMPVAQEFVPARSAEPSMPEAPETRSAVLVASREVFDLSALEPVAVAAERTEQVDPLFAEDGWAPTPVPPPTYTLKAKAYRPLPPPMEVSDVPVPIEVESDEIAWDEQLRQPRIMGA